MKRVSIDSIETLRQRSKDWDELWSRSEVTMPTLRAESLVLWLEQFMPQANFVCPAVEDDGKLVAALPLVRNKIGPGLHAGCLPSNEWMSSGDLLVDQSFDPTAVMDQLAGGLCELPYPLLWLNDIVLDSTRWTALLEALDRAKIATDVHPRYEVGLIDVQSSWDSYWQGRSKNHRRKITKNMNRLKREGQVRFVCTRGTTDGQLEEAMRTAFEIEDRSWKGQSGTSALRSAGMFDYLIRQSNTLARRGHLLLTMLEVDGNPIAFSYGWLAKGVFHSYKIGYDPKYATYGPGHLLRSKLLEHLRGPIQCHTFDCLGELNEASAKWTTNRYAIGRIVIAPRRLLGQLLFHAYRRWWPTLRKLRAKAT